MHDTIMTTSVKLFVLNDGPLAHTASTGHSLLDTLF